MFENDKFLLESSPIFGETVNNNEQSSVFKARQRAIRYLEMSCSAEYGFPGEAHIISEKKTKSISMIPTVYDSSLLLPLLLKEEGLSETIPNCLISVIKKNRQNGVNWNYFQRKMDLEGNYFPDEMDITGLSMMALFLTGNANLEDCRPMAKKMIRSGLRDQNEALTAWLPLKSENGGLISDDKNLKIAKMRGGCLINVLWFLASSGMDAEEIPSVDCVEKFVDILIQHKGSEDEIPGMVYYTNKYLIHFFLTRYLAISNYARTRFLSKYLDLLKFDCENLANIQDHSSQKGSAFNIAAIVLAMMTLNLHKEDPENIIKWRGEEIRGKIKKLIDVLLSIQDIDGSFPAGVVFRWNRLGHYGGSKVITSGFALAAIGMAKREGILD